MALYRANTWTHVLDLRNSSCVKYPNSEVLSAFNSIVGRYCTSKNNKATNNETQKQPQKISTAMRLYLENARKYDEFIRQERNDFEKGKRHLANMMDMDYNMMTQADIDAAISYLFPSGLYQKSARPFMKPPELVYPIRKAAQFDVAGRPFHSMFYTKKPNYHKIIYDIVEEMEKLNIIKCDLDLIGITPGAEHLFESQTSDWISKKELESKINELLTDDEYEYFINTLDRLSTHPCSKEAHKFIMEYRLEKQSIKSVVANLVVETDDLGRQFVFVDTCRAKSSRGEVKLIANGTGKVTVNDFEGIDYFKQYQSREQILFPLVFTNNVNKFDVEATVVNGGPTSQACAIRWGIAQALTKFVDDETIEAMRIAGLLTKDFRRRERKKPGQEGARRKFTWKAR